jgi:hypothetical protein
MIPPTMPHKDRTVPLEDEVRCLLRRLMKESGKDRPTLAQTMTDVLNRPVTPSMLAEFTRNGNGRRQNRFPCAWMKPFNAAVGNDKLTRSQLLEQSRKALALGELMLPWLSEQVQLELAKLVEGQRRSKR